MDYSLSIKNLLNEITRIKSYSRLNPVLRVITFILMLPLMAVALSALLFYYVLLFFRNGSQIAVDELEAWLNKRKEGSHFIPEAVIYAATIPTIFFLRVLLTVFSGILYFTWFTIMFFSYFASLGGIRWQPYLNTASFDIAYTWDFKHTNKTFNIFAIINIVLVVLCILQMLVLGTAHALLTSLTLVMIYLVYPKIFKKENLREMDSAEEIYAEAISYTTVQSVSNYTRASKLMKSIPDYNNALEIADRYDTYIVTKKASRAKLGIILMIILASFIVLSAVVPPVVAIVEDIVETVANDDDHLVYRIDESDEFCSVGCNSYSVKRLTIESKYKGKDVTTISNGAFDGCDKLRTITIPSTITKIEKNAFRYCESLETIKFEGTRTEWMIIEKEMGWNTGAGSYVIECTDGTIG